MRLVVERGEAMHNAAEEHPGTMAAVMGADDDAVDAACQRAEGEVWVANYNAPGQVVIAGTAEARGTRPVPSPRSSGPARCCPSRWPAPSTPCSWPRPRSWLRKSLASTAFSVPEVPVVANVDARAHTAAEDWPGLLSAQLCSPVRWRQSLETLGRHGRHPLRRGRHRAGCSPGSPERTLPDALASAVATPDDLDTLVNAIAGSETWNTYAAAHQGEHLYTSERVVISPAAGRVRARRRLAAPGPGGLAPDGTDVPGAEGAPWRWATCSARWGPPRSGPRSPGSWWASWPTPASGSPPASPSPGCACRPTARERPRRGHHRVGHGAPRHRRHQRATSRPASTPPTNGS